MGSAATIKPGKLPRESPCSFSWSIQALLGSLGSNVSSFEIQGYSLNAFAIWAHPHQPVKLWSEAFCDMFVEMLLRSLGLRGELLEVPPEERDLIGHFLNHWAARVEANLRAGVPVAACGAWTEAVWGIITSWDSSGRVIKGFIPGVEEEIENTSWPSKILVVAGSSVKPDTASNGKLVLGNILALGDNRFSKDSWVSGTDAYVLWRRRIAGQYSREQSEHIPYAHYLSLARSQASYFFTHIAGIFGGDVERLLLSVARRYHHSASYLQQASDAPAERAFLSSVTAALGEEEKAFALVEEVLFHLE